MEMPAVKILYLTCFCLKKLPQMQDLAWFLFMVAAGAVVRDPNFIGMPDNWQIKAMSQLPLAIDCLE